MRRFGALLIALLLIPGGAFAKTARYITPQFLEVCTGGACAYTTITAALAAITDAADNKRYTIFVHNGDYVESFTAKSYVSIVGENKWTTRVGCSGGCTTLTVPSTATAFGISNFMLAGRIPMQGSGAASSAQEFYISDMVMGSTDGTFQTNSVDCFVASGSGSSVSRTFYATGNIYRTTFDCIRVIDGDFWNDTGSQMFVVTSTQAGLTPRLVSTEGNGAQIRINGMIVDYIDTGTGGALGHTEFFRNDGTATPTHESRYEFQNVRIRMQFTGGAHNAARRCFYLKEAAPFASIYQQVVRIIDTTCEVYVSGSSNATTFMQIDADQDHVNYDVLIQGGKSLLIGGSTRTDIANAETGTNGACTGSGTPFACCSGAGAGTCSFALRVNGLEHAGVYSGSGTNAFVGSPIVGAQIKNSGSCLATAPGTCSIGDFYCDTSGGICYCTAANTWTNVTPGPIGNCT